MDFFFKMSEIFIVYISYFINFLLTRVVRGEKSGTTKKEDNGLQRERDWRKGYARRINLKRGFE